MSWRNSHIRLRQLEAEAIYIIRETVAEFGHPVMLYSIGKDSSVMLHVAQKAFYPSKPPFPLLHVDTTWKFREMIAFRDETAARLGMDLIVPQQIRVLANSNSIGQAGFCRQSDGIVPNDTFRPILRRSFALTFGWKHSF